MHDVDPFVGWYLPSAHGVHAVASPRLNVPAGHGTAGEAIDGAMYPGGVAEQLLEVPYPSE